ncbi:hypothetical protein DL95DRAFT_525165 [Leptodontidium sp. 2 PMI_412]|nr:hypothetical protein DL95DRAFT_525165 [Leptodontidium sp. 2 PMI_412]
MSTLAVPGPQSQFAMLDRVYNPKAYDTLASLRQAHDKLTPDVMDKLTGPIRKVFLDHKAVNNYGIILLRNHFQMPSHQRLVEHGPISIPWDMGNEDKNTVSTCARIISPGSIRLLDSKLAPFEFAFSLTEFELNEEFLEAAFRIIQDLGLDKIPGVRYFDTYDAELTVDHTRACECHGATRSIFQ